MITTRVVQVNKAVAESYLALERKPELGVLGTNRPRSMRMVREYARAMLRGEWRLTHQGLAFKGTLGRKDAELIDGGHRAEAVVYAATVGFPEEDPPLPPQPDITIDFMVTDGLTEEDMLAMDIGLRRTPSHFMAMAGEASSTLLAAICKVTWLYMHELMDTYDGRRKTPLSPPQARAHLEAYPSLRDAVREGARMGRIFTPTAAGSFWFLAINSGYDEKDVNEFLDGLLFGENMERGDARHVLREMMLNSRKFHRPWDTSQQLALLIKAFLRWLRGDDVKQITFRVTESFPKL